MSRHPLTPARKLQRLIVAGTPMLLAAAVVGAATAVRVTTPVQLELTVRAVAFTVADGAAVPLLNDSTVFSKLTIEGCDAVRLPPLNIAVEGATPIPSPGTVTFRCDPRLPNAKVIVRGDGRTALGNIERILARPGDRIGLELAGIAPPGLRLEMSPGTSFVFSLAPNVPFELVSEFAVVDGLATPDDPDRVVGFAANLSDTHISRQATVLSGRGLNIVIEPSGDAGVESLFSDSVRIPIESISLFQRRAVDGVLVSTAIDGTLTYTGLETDSVKIRPGETVSFRGEGGFRLAGLRVDREREGLALTLEGDAEELATGGTDRRVTLLDRVVSGRNRTLFGIVAVVASQVVWLRQFWASGRAPK